VHHHRKVVLLLFGLLATLVSAAPGIGQSVPACYRPTACYRYTGWVSQVVGRQPQHLIVVGGSFRLLFNDYANPSPTEAYRVCYAKVGRTPHCTQRTLSGVHVDAVLRTIGHTGQYIARWYVRGHVVASWPFLVAQGD
jgi:hypothetical protein